MKYMGKGMLRIDLELLVDILILFPHFKTAYMNQEPLLDNMFNLLRLISGMVILVMMLKRNKINQLTALFIAFQYILLMSTIWNRGDLKSLIFDSCSIITLSVYIDYMLKQNTKKIINALLFCFELQIYLNLITVILFPDGLYSDWTNNNWFLGTDNQHVYTMIFGICIALIQAKLSNRFARVICLSAASLFSIFWVWSATAVAGILLYFTLFLAIVVLRVNFFNYLNLSMFNLVFFFSIIVFKVQNLFQFFIEDFLGKSLTFTGRTYIWERAIYWIKKSWLIGYGYERASLHQLKTIFPYCHNILLEQMYQGGIILILCLLLIQLCFGRLLMIYVTNYYAKVITISVFILYFMMLFETLSMVRVFPLFLLAYHIEQIMECDQKSKEERQVCRNERAYINHCPSI